MHYFELVIIVIGTHGPLWVEMKVFVELLYSGLEMMCGGHWCAFSIVWQVKTYIDLAQL